MASRSNTIKRATKRKDASPLGRRWAYGLAAVFACVFFALVLSFCHTLAFGVSTTETFSYDEGMRYTNEVNPHKTSTGAVAYCMTMNLKHPEGAGTYTYAGICEDVVVNYIVAHGYPATKTIMGTTYDADEARVVTQVAIWYHMERANGNDNPFRWKFPENDTEPELYALVEAAIEFALEAEAKGPSSGVPYGGTTWYLDGAHQTMMVVGEVPFGDIEFNKVDAALGRGEAQGNMSLAGAQFTVKFYDNTSGKTSGAPTRTWVLKADEKGEVKLDKAHFVGGSDPYVVDGDYVAPAGTYVVTETKAPDGYDVDGASKTVVMSADSCMDGTYLDAWKNVTFRDVARYHSFTIQKRDAENGNDDPIGAGSWDGVSFEVYNVSKHPIKVVGKGNEVATTTGSALASGALVGTYTLADGATSVEVTGVPAGSYHVIEKTRSTDGSYYRNGGWSMTVTVGTDGKASLDTTVEGTAAANQVVRHDLEFVKTGEGQERLAGVAFLLTADSTGETHVIVTDRNGAWSSAGEGGIYSSEDETGNRSGGSEGAAYASHTKDTNANDAAVTAVTASGEKIDLSAYSCLAAEERVGCTFEVDEGALSAGVGCWFYGESDPSLQINAATNDLRALPWDTYTITELSTTANEGYDLVTLPVSLQGSSRATYGIGDIDDADAPRIATSLASVDGTTLIPALEAVDLVDTVTYANLEAGKRYTLKAEAHVVTYEDGMPHATDEVVGMGTTTFTAASSGTATVALDAVDVSQLPAGASLVCFETLLDDEGDEVATHADEQDRAQFVTVAAKDFDEENLLEADVADDSLVRPGKTIAYRVTMRQESEDAVTMSVTDTMSCGLVFGGTVRATDEDGAEVAVSVGEATTDDAGVTTVTWTTTDAVEPGTLVTFHYIGIVTEEAEGLSQVANSATGRLGEEPDVWLGKLQNPLLLIETSAGEATSGASSVRATDEVTIVDTVNYYGLTPGKRYKVAGTLHLVETDEGGVATDGGEVPSQSDVVEFVPEKADGSVDVTLTLDARELGGQSVVVFERVYEVEGDDGFEGVEGGASDDGDDDGTDEGASEGDEVGDDAEDASEDVLVAVHEDPAAAPQTVSVVSPAEPEPASPSTSSRMPQTGRGILAGVLVVVGAAVVVAAGARLHRVRHLRRRATARRR